MLVVGRGCMVRLAVLLLLGVGLLAAWRWGGALLPQEVRQWTERLPGVSPTAPAPSPADAAAAVARYEALVEGEVGGEVRLNADEVTGALRFRIPDAVPEPLSRPAVGFADDIVRVTGRVPLEELSAPDRLHSILPDTVDLLLQGLLVPLEGGSVALVVQRARASGLPIPGRLQPGVLEVLGRPDRRDLPPNVLPLPLPPGVSRAYLDGDALILSRER